VIAELKTLLFGLLDKVYTTGIPFYGDELLAGLCVMVNWKTLISILFINLSGSRRNYFGVTIIAIEVTNK
jgi:hypothetical protein